MSRLFTKRYANGKQKRGGGLWAMLHKHKHKPHRTFAPPNPSSHARKRARRNARASAPR